MSALRLISCSGRTSIAYRSPALCTRLLSFSSGPVSTPLFARMTLRTALERDFGVLTLEDTNDLYQRFSPYRQLGWGKGFQDFQVSVTSRGTL